MASKGVYYGPGNAGAAQIFDNSAWQRNLAMVERTMVRNGAAEARAAAAKAKADAERAKEDRKWLDKVITESGDGMFQPDLEILNQKQKSLLEYVAQDQAYSRDPVKWAEAQKQHADIMNLIAGSKDQNRTIQEYHKTINSRKDIDQDAASAKLAAVYREKDPRKRAEMLSGLTVETYLNPLDGLTKDLSQLKQATTQTARQTGRFIQTETTTSYTPEQLDGVADMRMQDPMRQKHYANTFEQLPEQEQQKYGNAYEYGFQQQRQALDKIKAEEFKKDLKNLPQYKTTGRKDLSDDQKETLSYLQLQAGLVKGDPDLYINRSFEFASPTDPNVMMLESDAQKGDVISKSSGKDAAVTIDRFLLDPVTGKTYLVTNKSKRSENPLIELSDATAYGNYIQGHFGQKGKLSKLDKFMQENNLSGPGGQIRLDQLRDETAPEVMAKRKGAVESETAVRKQVVGKVGEIFDLVGSDGQKSGGTIKKVNQDLANQLQLGTLYIKGQPVPADAKIDLEDDSLLGGWAGHEFKVRVTYTDKRNKEVKEIFSPLEFKKMLQRNTGPNRFVLSSRSIPSKSGNNAEFDFEEPAPAVKPSKEKKAEFDF